MFKIHPYALIFTAVWIGLALFHGAYFYDDITFYLSDLSVWFWAVAALYLGSPLNKERPSEDTPGNTLFIYAIGFLLLIVFLGNDMKIEKNVTNTSKKP